MDLIVAMAIAGAVLAGSSVALGVWLAVIWSQRPTQVPLAALAVGIGLIVFGLFLARDTWGFWDRPII